MIFNILTGNKFPCIQFVIESVSKTLVKIQITKEIIKLGIQLGQDIQKKRYSINKYHQHHPFLSNDFIVNLFFVVGIVTIVVGVVVVLPFCCWKQKLKFSLGSLLELAQHGFKDVRTKNAPQAC